MLKLWVPFFSGTKTICSRFCDLLDLKIKLRLHIPHNRSIIRTRSSILLKLQCSFHLDVIAQLHVYHPWHWRNVSFPESPHKTLIYKSLAEISPLAKLPSQAVDFRTQCLQSAAQHETSLWEGMRQRDGGRSSGERGQNARGRGNNPYALCQPRSTKPDGL